MIVLYTDFGLAGPYTGQIKAVLARLAPQVPVIDLFADLPAFAPRLAAYLLAAYTARFEPGDVILAVVDPGVGSARQALTIEADGAGWSVRQRPVRADPAPCRNLERLADRAFARPNHRGDVPWPRPVRACRGPPGPGSDAAGARGGTDRLPAWPDDLAAITYVDHYGNAMTGLRAAGLADAIVEVAGTGIRRAGSLPTRRRAKPCGTTMPMAWRRSRSTAARQPPLSGCHRAVRSSCTPDQKKPCKEPALVPMLGPGFGAWQAVRHRVLVPAFAANPAAPANPPGISAPGPAPRSVSARKDPSRPWIDRRALWACAAGDWA